MSQGQVLTSMHFIYVITDNAFSSHLNLFSKTQIDSNSKWEFLLTDKPSLMSQWWYNHMVDRKPVHYLARVHERIKTQGSNNSKVS